MRVDRLRIFKRRKALRKRMACAVTDRAVLSAKNEVLFTAVVSWPSEYVVRVGIVLSSFGAGLQSNPNPIPNP